MSLSSPRHPDGGSRGSCSHADSEAGPAGSNASCADAGKGVIAGTLRFRSTTLGLAGVYVGLHGNATELSNLHATGPGVSFDLVTPTAVWHLDGTLSGDSIDGTFRTADRRHSDTRSVGGGGVGFYVRC